MDRHQILRRLTAHLDDAYRALAEVNGLSCRLHDQCADDDVDDVSFDATEAVTDDLHQMIHRVNAARHQAAVAALTPAFRKD